MDVAGNAIAMEFWDVAFGGGLITVCAWCESAFINGEWVVLPFGLLKTIDQPVTLSHSICPKCALPA